jgi:predicted MFS family arabinose efflux permease
MKLNIRSMPIIGLIIAESLSLVGNQIAAVAIPILVLQFTNSPIITGIASAANIAPIILAAIVGGRAIDRFGAWNISVAADLLSFFSVLALPFAFIYFDQVSPFLIFLLVFLGALFDPTGISARQTLVPNLAKLSAKSLPKINSWRGGLENAADFLGPAIGVGLIAAIGIVNTFLINAVTFLLCAGIFSITVPRKREITSIGNEGAAPSSVTFIFKHPQLRPLAIAGIFGIAASGVDHTKVSQHDFTRCVPISFWAGSNRWCSLFLAAFSSILSLSHLLWRIINDRRFYHPLRGFHSSISSYILCGFGWIVARSG